MHKPLLHAMIRQTTKLACLLVCLFILSACGGGGDTSSNADSTGGLSFKLHFVDSSDPQAWLSNADVDICEEYGINEITASLSRMNGTELAFDAWPCSEHSGVLDGIEPTTDLVLTVGGMVDDELQWKGQLAGIEILPDQITAAGKVLMLYITEDAAAPQVVATSPYDGAGDVPLNTAITVDFDEPVSAVLLYNGFLLTDDNSNSVSGTVSYEDNDDDQLYRAIFTPDGDLNAQTQYEVTLLEVVEDLAGNPIDEQYSWSFSCFDPSGTIPVTGVSVVPTTASIDVDDTVQLTATVAPSDATNKNVSWSSSDTAVATVSSSGLVTGVAEGTATITVTTEDGSFTAQCTITVTDATISININSGGPATDSFTADQYYSGGSTYSTSASIDMSQITNNPPPAAIFQTERYGDFTYTIPNLTPGSEQTVTLYFAEIYWSEPGLRVFNVSINGTTALNNFDVYAAAGGMDMAIAETFNTTADSSGRVVIQFIPVIENPKVSGISITGSGGGGDVIKG
jgi:uncharacterized protein YjdB